MSTTTPGSDGPDPDSAVTEPVAAPDSAVSEPATDDQDDRSHVFRLQKLFYFTVPVAALVAVILAGASLVWLGWTLLLPVVLAVWIARLSTTVTEDGLRTTSLFGSRSVAWDEIDGLQFPRWTAVRAVLVDGRRVRLPAITFQDMPRLSVASRGRIPDPYAQSPTSG